MTRVPRACEAEIQDDFMPPATDQERHLMQSGKVLAAQTTAPMDELGPMSTMDVGSMRCCLHIREARWC